MTSGMTRDFHQEGPASRGGAPFVSNPAATESIELLTSSTVSRTQKLFHYSHKMDCSKRKLHLSKGFCYFSGRSGENMVTRFTHLIFATAIKSVRSQVPEMLKEPTCAYLLWSISSHFTAVTPYTSYHFR